MLYCCCLAGARQRDAAIVCPSHGTGGSQGTNNPSLAAAVPWTPMSDTSSEQGGAITTAATQGQTVGSLRRARQFEMHSTVAFAWQIELIDFTIKCLS